VLKLVFSGRDHSSTFPAIFEPGRKGDWPGGKIEQIAVEMEIANGNSNWPVAWSVT
jgi:hypothetical protein